MLSSLCFPDGTKSCFACCPPIRPAGYDHLDHKNIIKRVLLENTYGYRPDERNTRPVTGFSCWAMGYLDPDYRQPGCLLHPLQNNGEDLRFRIDYGTKCLREICNEAKIFEMLNECQKSFWLNLTDGLDSFEYSSRKINPLFRLLGWGEKILSQIADKESGKRTDRAGFFRSYPFLESSVPSKGYAYLLTYIVNDKGPEILMTAGFERSFRSFSTDLINGIKERFDIGAGPVYVHKMDFDLLFADFIRIPLGIKKSEYTSVEKIKYYADNQLRLFCCGLKI